MNRCQKRVLLAWGVTMTVLAVLGIASAIAASPTGLVIGILVAWGLISIALSALFKAQWDNCTR
jgi:uncharacterized membrane protein